MASTLSYRRHMFKLMMIDYNRRKPQQKKHKTWEGDGILKSTGGKAALHDQETSAVYVIETP